MRLVLPFLLFLLVLSACNSATDNDQSEASSNEAPETTTESIPETPPSDRENLTLAGDSLVQKVHSLAFCELVPEEIASELVGEAMVLDINSPADTPPKTCVFTGPDTQITIMAIAGPEARKHYDVNVEGFGAGDVKEALSRLGEMSFGYNFRGMIMTDIYYPGLWLNIAVVGSKSEEEKILMVKSFAEAFTMNL
ncbi:MAG: hypothetical protein AAF598_01975 [Bacteroidota bacterium]